MSRLTKRTEKQTKRKIFTSIVGILFLAFLVWKFSFFFLDKLGSLAGKNKTIKQEKPQTINFVSTPVLNNLPQATNSANIKISGYSLEKKGKIELFINDNFKNITELKSDSSFIFDDVTLDEGQNIIKIRLKNQTDNYSDFSNSYSISYLKNAPKLEIKSPANGAIFSHDNKQITLQGTTDPDDKITVNNYRAIVDESGNFSYQLDLKNGENDIQVTAQNPAGATSKQDLKVTYMP